MTQESNDDDDVVVSSSTNTADSPNLVTGQTESDAPAALLTDDDSDDSVIVQSTPTEDTDENLDTTTIGYEEDKVDFRGEDEEALAALIRADFNLIGGGALDNRIQTVGTWENNVARAIFEPNFEERRMREALGKLTPEDKEALYYRYPKEGRVKLRTVSILERLAAGSTQGLTGDAAMLAFECQDKGGGFRIPLYNSGITIDVMTPTGNDIQTLLSNCLIVDKQLGSANGAHYFAYNDIMYKTQILNFLQPLIINSSFSGWRKPGQLWSVIKLPDLANIMATLSAMCYQSGFEGFVVKCTRPVTTEHPNVCGHTETLTVDIFKLIMTRFATMSPESIEFMVAARSGTKHSINEIAQYQAGLGFEGEKIVFDNLTLTMRIPTLSEHIEAGNQFIADIINEVEGDNTDGRLEQFGFRYMRTFLPFIAGIEREGSDGLVYQTAEPKVITRMLEKLDDKDDEGGVRDKLRDYINKCQLTYVGYPATACPNCGHTADTPSGLYTFDPFNAFFTLAFQYLKPASSKPAT